MAMFGGALIFAEKRADFDALLSLGRGKASGHEGSYF
jgi:hypothetical protein